MVTYRWGSGPDTITAAQADKNNPTQTSDFTVHDVTSTADTAVNAGQVAVDSEGNTWISYIDDTSNYVASSRRT